MVSGTPLRFRPPPTPSEGTVEASLPRPLLRAMLFLSSCRSLRARHGVDVFDAVHEPNPGPPGALARHRPCG